MSHYTGHHASMPTPKARVAFFGCSLVATGLLGFYAFLHKKHERKHMLDRTSDTEARISSWESRMIQRANPISSSTTPETLRASRIEARGTPLPAPATSHNVQHRTLADDAAAGRAREYAQPTAQKGHSDGRGVYTKNPGWREAIHFVSGSRAAGTGVGEGEQAAAAELVQKAKEGVKSVFGK